MSDQTPNRTPFTPLHPRLPELTRDAQGNVFYREADGNWRHHDGPIPQSLMSSIQEPVRPPFASMHDRINGGPDSPIEHAFPEYQFTLRPAPATNQLPIPIDPALLPLPAGADLDLTHGGSVAKARGLKPAEKVAGSRQKGKEKERAHGKRQRASSGSEDDLSEPARKRGRPAGSGNYQTIDTTSLFDIVADERPIGQKGWKVVGCRFNKAAALNGRPKRSDKSLETKFKGYLKFKKPTGSGVCPPEVKRAYEIEELINQRVGTRNVSDSEFDSDNDSDDEIEVVDRPAGAQRTAVARRAPTPPLRRPRTSGADLANKISRAFDPEVQRAREDTRSQRSFENTQLLTVSQQLRDTQATVESLRLQLSAQQTQLHQSDRARERAEMRLELMQTVRGRSRDRSPIRPSHDRSIAPSARNHPRSNFHRRSHKNMPGVERVRGKIRCEQTYPEGGAQTWWVSDPSTGDEDDEEENHDPWDGFEAPRRSRSSRSHHTTSRHRNISRRRTPTPGPSRRAVSRRRTPTPGPSRIQDNHPSAPLSFSAGPSTFPSSAVIGSAVELTVTPRRGPAVALVISPAPPSPQKK